MGVDRQADRRRERQPYIGDKTLKCCLTGKEGNGIKLRELL